MTITSELAYELKKYGFPQTFALGRRLYVGEEKVTVTTHDEAEFEKTVDVSKVAAIPTILELESLIRTTVDKPEATLAMNTKEGFAIAVIENYSAEGESLDEALAKLFIKRNAAGN